MAILNRISKMSYGYSLSIKGYPPSVNKGKLEMIEMSIASRSGNKKVTLVHNLDIFKIDLQEFAHKCQVGVAASSSTSVVIEAIGFEEVANLDPNSSASVQSDTSHQSPPSEANNHSE